MCVCVFVYEWIAYGVIQTLPHRQLHTDSSQLKRFGPNKHLQMMILFSVLTAKSNTLTLKNIYKNSYTIKSARAQQFKWVNKRVKITNE